MMPVCTGWLTGLRRMMPGAIFSTGYATSLAIGPLPSIGSPSVLTTRPSNPLPTGTCSSLPVARTSSPSSRLVYSPRTMTPTSVSWRLSARPVMPLPKSSISFSMTSPRPSTLATPSPISRMTPMFCLTAVAFAPAICASMSCIRLAMTRSSVLSLQSSVPLQAPGSQLITHDFKISESAARRPFTLPS